MKQPAADKELHIYSRMSDGQQGGGREPADILENLREAIKMADEMADAGMLKRKDADRAIKVAQAKYKAEMKLCKAELKPTTKVKGTAASGPQQLPGADTAEEAEEAAQPAKKQKVGRSCADGNAVATAMTFASYAEAREACKKAFDDGALFPHLGDHSKAAFAPSFNRPSGAGDPNRGYVDWEFKDGTACR